MICAAARTGTRMRVPVEHVTAPPPRDRTLAVPERLLRGSAPELLALWKQWNGLRLCAQVGTEEREGAAA